MTSLQRLPSKHTPLRTFFSVIAICGLLVSTGCRSTGMGWLGWGGSNSDAEYASSLPDPPSDSANATSVDTAALQEFDPEALDGVPDEESHSADSVAEARGVQDGGYSTTMPGADNVYPQESASPSWNNNQNSNPAYTADARNSAGYNASGSGGYGNYESPANYDQYGGTQASSSGGYNTGNYNTDSYGSSSNPAGAYRGTSAPAYGTDSGFNAGSQAPNNSGYQPSGGSNSGYSAPASGSGYGPQAGYDSSEQSGYGSQPASPYGAQDSGNYIPPANSGQGYSASPANFQNGGNSWSQDYPAASSPTYGTASNQPAGYSPGSTNRTGNLAQYEQDQYSAPPVDQNRYASPYPSTSTPDQGQYR
jgi:hypothetical protein